MENFNYNFGINNGNDDGNNRDNNDDVDIGDISKIYFPNDGKFDMFDSSDGLFRNFIYENDEVIKFKHKYGSKINGKSMEFHSSGISDTRVFPRMLRYLKHYASKMNELILNHNKITSKGASLLFDLLRKQKSTIKKISLCGNSLDNECIKSLGEYIRNNVSIEHIDIEKNSISDNGIKVLTPYLIENTNLHTLKLSWNDKITDKSINFLNKIIKNSCVDEITIKGTNITDKNAFLFLLAKNGFKNKKSVIDVSNGGLKNDNVSKFCKFIEENGCETIRTMDIGGNELKLQEYCLILNTLKGCKPSNIINLYMSNGVLDTNSMEILGGFIQSCNAIIVIDISNNKITDDCIEILLSYLNVNSTLKKINISFNEGITDKSIPLLNEIIQKSNIVDINIDQTSITNQNVFNACQLIKNDLKNKSNAIVVGKR